MFTLKITKSDNSIEESSFETEEMALNWKAHLLDIGYIKDSYTKHHEEVIIHHASVDAVIENAIEISPAIQAHDEVIAAYDEIIPASYTFEIISMPEPIEDISPRQIRLALLSLGLTEAVIDSAISNLSSPIKEQAMIAWKYSTTFQRGVPIVSSIGTLLGLTSQELDQLWIQGRSL